MFTYLFIYDYVITGICLNISVLRMVNVKVCFLILIFLVFNYKNSISKFHKHSEFYVRCILKVVSSPVNTNYST